MGRAIAVGAMTAAGLAVVGMAAAAVVFLVAIEIIDGDGEVF